MLWSQCSCHYSPAVVEYDIELTYYTTAENESATIETVEGTGGAIEQYIEWQSATIGRDINPDKLRALILKPDGDAVGAYRVSIVSPTFTAIDDTTMAKHSGKIVVNHEVVEE